MDDINVALIFIGSIFTLGVGIATLGKLDGMKDVMYQAYERGFAVQCVGKEGYYWECE